MIPHTTLCQYANGGGDAIWWNPRNINERVLVTYGDWNVSNFRGDDVHRINRTSFTFTVPRRAGDPYTDRGMLVTQTYGEGSERVDVFLPSGDAALAARILDSVH